MENCLFHFVASCDDELAEFLYLTKNVMIFIMCQFIIKRTVICNFHVCLV